MGVGLRFCGFGFMGVVVGGFLLSRGVWCVGGVWWFLRWGGGWCLALGL